MFLWLLTFATGTSFSLLVKTRSWVTVTWRLVGSLLIKAVAYN